jgi:hypothetical protein
MKEEIKKALSTNLASYPNEVWFEIPGYEGRYEVSNFTRIKSIIKRFPVILRKSISSGRFKVTLVNSRGKPTNANCGRIVAKVFIAEPNPDQILIYLDGDVLNDLPGNLKYITKTGAERNSIKGELNGMAILNSNQVKEIRRKRERGNTYNQLKNEYSVSIGCIHNIVTYKNWKNI